MILGPYFLSCTKGSWDMEYEISLITNRTNFTLIDFYLQAFSFYPFLSFLYRIWQPINKTWVMFACSIFFLYHYSIMLVCLLISTPICISIIHTKILTFDGFMHSKSPSIAAGNNRLTLLIKILEEGLICVTCFYDKP